MEENLKFKSGNPGAVQYGNFINYYQFHSPENRLKLLPYEIIFEECKGSSFHGLDLGCNSGVIDVKKHNLKYKNKLCISGSYYFSIQVTKRKI